MDPRLRALLDREEIRQLLLRYMRGVDRGDPELILSVFHPEATTNMGYGDVKIVDVVDRIAKFRKGGMHFLGNTLIDVDGDRAGSEAYWISFQTFERDGVELQRVRGARSVDRLERRNDEWRILARTVVDDWSRIDKIVETVEGVGQHPGGSVDEDFVYTSGVAKRR